MFIPTFAGVPVGFLLHPQERPPLGNAKKPHGIAVGLPEWL